MRNVNAINEPIEVDVVGDIEAVVMLVIMRFRCNS
jgi:hypothetical protein